MHKYEIETNSIQKVLLEYKCGLWRVEISTRCKCIEYTPSNEDKAREWFEFVISDIKKGKMLLRYTLLIGRTWNLNRFLYCYR